MTRKPQRAGAGARARHCWAAESRLQAAGPGSPSPPGAGRVPPCEVPPRCSRGRGRGEGGVRAAGTERSGTGASPVSPGPRVRWPLPPRGHPVWPGAALTGDSHLHLHSVPFPTQSWAGAPRTSETGGRAEKWRGASAWPPLGPRPDPRAPPALLLLLQSRCVSTWGWAGGRTGDEARRTAETAAGRAARRRRQRRGGGCAFMQRPAVGPRERALSHAQQPIGGGADKERLPGRRRWAGVEMRPRPQQVGRGAGTSGVVGWNVPCL